MSKSQFFAMGALVGAAVAAAVTYLFAPARGTTFDENYRSRLDWALEEGQRAADAREVELRRQFEQAKQPVSKTSGDFGLQE